MAVTWRDIGEIQTDPVFSSIFTIKEHVYRAIVNSMEADGYDDAFPIVCWKRNGALVVVDGHARLRAAKECGINNVPVVVMEFEDEDEAYLYAVHVQRDRRNLTDAELLRVVPEVDRRSRQRAQQRQIELGRKLGGKPQEDLAGTTGGPLAPNGAKGGAGERKSAEETAKALGISTRKVERVRRVLGDPEVAAQVEAGEISIHKAAEIIQEKKAAEDQDGPPVEKPRPEVARLHRAALEVQAAFGRPGSVTQADLDALEGTLEIVKAVLAQLAAQRSRA